MTWHHRIERLLFSLFFDVVGDVDPQSPFHRQSRRKCVLSTEFLFILLLWLPFPCSSLDDRTFEREELRRRETESLTASGSGSKEAQNSKRDRTVWKRRRFFFDKKQESSYIRWVFLLHLLLALLADDRA
jgi:hypothetical protein